MTGQIIKIISNLYTVEIDNKIYDCRARGKFRNEEITPLVGDYCEVDLKNLYITKIMARKNSLNRPLISNVDYALVMTSVKNPELSLTLLDKMLSLITINNIKPVICFSKVDLLDKNEKRKLKQIIKDYQKIGYQVVLNTDIRKINKIFKNKLVVITGQTGSGKSTLINKLDKNLNLKTDEISKSLGRGKHTTRHVEIFKLKHFKIADTPGFSSLDFRDITNEQIKSSFLEFQKYTCQFKDCYHKEETGCQVKLAVKNNKISQSRYDNYLSFIRNRGK